jgi:DNA primase
MDDIKIQCVNPACSDEKDHLWINLEKKVYHCWKCGYKGRVVNNKLVLDALKRNKARKGPKKSFSSNTEDSFSVIDPSLFIPLSDLKPNHQALQYIQSRGITVEICTKMGGVYCPVGRLYGRIVFPIKDGNKIVGWQGRSVYDRIPKYIIFGKKSLGMYNMKPLASYTQFVIIFEGIFDVLKVPEYGISILGKKLSDVQLRMISTFLQVKNVFVMLDSDANKEELALCKELSPWFKTIPIQLKTGDPGNLSELEILELCLTQK